MPCTEEDGQFLIRKWQGKYLTCHQFLVAFKYMCHQGSLIFTDTYQPKICLCISHEASRRFMCSWDFSDHRNHMTSGSFRISAKCCRQRSCHDFWVVHKIQGHIPILFANTVGRFWEPNFFFFISSERKNL